MFLRLRDMAITVRYWGPGYYIDPRNLKIYHKVFIGELSDDIKNRLIDIPQFYKDKLLEMVCQFVEKEKDNYPELATIMDTTKEDYLKCKVLNYIDHYRYWDVWDAFAEKYLIRELKKWCIENGISYGM